MVEIHVRFGAGMCPQCFRWYHPLCQGVTMRAALEETWMCVRCVELLPQFLEVTAVHAAKQAAASAQLAAKQMEDVLQET